MLLLVTKYIPYVIPSFLLQPSKTLGHYYGPGSHPDRLSTWVYGLGKDAFKTIPWLVPLPHRR